MNMILMLIGSLVALSVVILGLTLSHYFPNPDIEKAKTNEALSV